MTASHHISLPAEWQVPEFDLTEFFPRKHRYCVCIFVINEGERVQAQLQAMKDLSGSADLLIGDGGSTDGSLAPAFLEACQVRSLLVKRGGGRLSAQMRMALAYAMAEGYEGSVVIDGNNKDDTSAVPRFLEKLDEGFDHLQGSRYIPGGRGINTPPLRHFAVQLVHAPLMSLAAGFRYTDTTNGFRAYSRRFLLDERVQPFRDVFRGYELHYYLAIRAARLGFRVGEIPVTRSYPPRLRGTVTPTKISPLRGNVAVFLTLLRACLGRYSPPRPGARAPE